MSAKTTDTEIDPVVRYLMDTRGDSLCGAAMTASRLTPSQYVLMFRVATGMPLGSAR